MELENSIEENIEEENGTIPLDEQNNVDKNANLTRIGSQFYDKDTLNRITIVQLTQIGLSQMEIRRILNVTKSLVSKWANYDKREHKKKGRPEKFNEEEKNFIYQTSEGRLTVINKTSSRNISSQFFNKFNKTISKSTINNLLLERFGKPYRGVNSILLTEDHMAQRLLFSNEIIEQKIKGSDIIFTDECRVVLYPRVNPKINVIRLNDEDKKNIHSYEVNKKRTFYRPKFEVSLMIAGGITEYGLSNLVFCSGTMNNFSYKQFLLFLKKDMDQIKKEFKLDKDLLFQQDNASCHKSRKSLEAIEVIFGKNKIWWPANSLDLSPIKTVWSILKQELMKRKNTCLDELRNNIIDILSKFPNELCKKIIGEFEKKINLCKEVEGKILGKIKLKAENQKEVSHKEVEPKYDWDSIKREKCFRIVYNDKIISMLQNRFIKTINHLKKEKIKEFKKNNKKTKKIKGVTSQERKKIIDSDLKIINDNYETLIAYIKNIKPLEFISIFLNDDYVNKKYLLNTNLSKNIQMNQKIFKKILLESVKVNQNTLDDEVKNKINEIFKSSEINRIKNYLLESVNLRLFPLEKEKKNNGDEDIASIGTECSFKDTCGLINDLEEKIKKFREENKYTKEEEKKIEIKNEEENEEDSESDSEEKEVSE